MDALLWKKFREMRNHKMRAILFVASVVFFGWFFSDISGLRPEVIAWVYPIVICFFANIVQANVDDFSQAVLFRALGVRMRSIWLINWVLPLFLAFAVAGPALLVFGAVYHWQLCWAVPINYLLSLPVGASLLALGALAYRSLSKAERAVSGVFNMILLAIVAIPFFGFLNMISDEVIILASALSVVGLFLSLLYFSLDSDDRLICNTEKLAKVYDDKFFGDG